MVKSKCDNCNLLSGLKQCIFSTCSTKKRAVWDMLLELLGSSTILRLRGVSGGNDSRQRGKEVAVVQRSLLKYRIWNHELEMLRWRTCLNMKHLLMDNNEAVERDSLGSLDGEH